MAERLGDPDRRFLDAAVRLGVSANGTTWPNPAVGAVLVRDGAVVSRGRTAPGGRPHAEEIALASAGEAARGATCYVSLEPCAWRSAAGHRPCADALIAAGVRRVVIAAADPNPHVNGAGRARLADAGVEIVFAPHGMRLPAAHAGYFTRLSLGRPRVTLKLAISADGAIGRAGEGQVAITGEIARRHVQALRSRADAILVGAGTIRADDPLLTCRLPGLEWRSPVRVVVAGREPLDPAAAVLKEGSAAPTWIVAASPFELHAPSHMRLIEARPGPDGVDLADAMRALGQAGLTGVLVEGGARLASALLDADLIDEAILFRSPVALGGAAVPALAGRSLAAIEDAASFRRVERRMFGQDTMTRIERVR